MAPLLELAVKNFKAAIVTMLNDIQEIQSYYECMLILTGWKEMPPEKQNLFKKGGAINLGGKIVSGGRKEELTEPTKKIISELEDTDYL